MSRKLGYRPDGISRDARGADALVSDRVRLTATEWARVVTAAITVEGIDQARRMFLG